MDKHCRTCFRSNECRKFDISTISQVSDVPISDMLIYCLQIETSPYDLLPQKICEACLSTLNSMFLFRKHCYHSDTELRKMLNYASAEHPSPAPHVDLELNLVDAQFTGETINLDLSEEDPENDPAVSSLYEQSPEESQEIPASENSKKEISYKRKLNKWYKCDQCDYKSSYKCNIIRHQQCRDHKGWKITSKDGETVCETPQEILAADNSSQASSEPIVVEEKYSTKTYECEQCDYKSSKKSNIIRHQQGRDHNGWKVTISRHGEASQEIVAVDDSSKTSDEAPDVKAIVVEKYLTKLYECEQCDYRSSIKCNIVRHQNSRNHTGIRETNPSEKAPQKSVRKMLCCLQCSFQTFVLCNFRRHQRVWKHKTYKTLDVEVKRVLEKCPTCPHCGVQRANLQAHMAQWCRVLRAKKMKEIMDSQANSANPAPASDKTAELKIEID